ncbi:nucleoid-associated protein [Fusibacter tunisiensis]|uniref:Nucleoid-associated protein n=1 Tax=Fusibacter tunisiensis TaxID=1008308 RepID=A0ABS2MS37_9FIRM|nr:nucleoid-associated protein [Fusibacter tunisiensis]MBM7562200.1 hypothetical protein [Fusibacter tunisiensis]
MEIKACYLHVLDFVGSTRIYSERPMELDADIEAYVVTRIQGFFDGYDVFEVPLVESAPLFGLMEKSKTVGFKNLGLGVADLFYEAMERSEDIKPCDLICAHIEEEGVEFFAFVKLNFKTSYVHLVETEDQSVINRIVRHVSTLPQKTQAPDEGFVVDWAGGKVLVKDKQVTLDGRRVSYISDLFLGGSYKPSPKKAMDVLVKTAEKVAQNFQSEGLVQTSRVRAAIQDLVETSEAIEPNQVAQACFETYEEREAYREAIADKGLEDAALTIGETHRKKMKRTQKIKTASGVEITLPYAYVAEGDNFEMTTNPDGTVSIQLKNLGALL